MNPETARFLLEDRLDFYSIVKRLFSTNEGRWDETAFGVEQKRSHGEQRVSRNTDRFKRLPMRRTIVSRQTLFHLTFPPLFTVLWLNFSVFTFHCRSVDDGQLENGCLPGGREHSCPETSRCPWAANKIYNFFSIFTSDIFSFHFHMIPRSFFNGSCLGFFSDCVKVGGVVGACRISTRRD